MRPIVKLAVLGYYLDFVARYVDLKKAIVATLGGNGHELEIWRDRGIAAKHGWMVERGRETRLKLITRFFYQLCTNLSALPNSIRGVSNPPLLDAFHLDLCGTLEPSIADFSGVLELVGRSRGRCVAITVTEERRNTDLEDDQLAKKLAEKLGEGVFQRFREQVIAEQNLFGKEKGVLREMGVLLHVIELFEKQRRFPVPDQIERIIYLSDMTPGKSFWMRTYLFHLGREIVPRKERAQRLVGVWNVSPLRAYREGQFVPIKVEEKENIMPEFSRLQTIAEAAGGEVLQEFRELMELMESAKRLEEAMPALRLLVGEQGEVSVTPPVKKNTIVKPVERQPAQPVGGNEFTRMDAQLEMLEIASKTGVASVGQQYVRLAKRLGIPTAKQGAVMRALFARTQGKFRPSFVGRVVAEFGDSFLAELVDYYSAIDGRAVTAEELRL